MEVPEHIQKMFDNPNPGSAEDALVMQEYFRQYPRVVRTLEFRSWIVRNVEVIIKLNEEGRFDP